MNSKRSEAIKRTVPWVNREEYEKVFRDLYSDNISKREYAVGRCHIWKSRVAQKLPVAIESTATLCNACIGHQRAEEENEISSRNERLCTEYSMALIRFVNHVTEKGQNRQFSKPVHMVAAEYGIPEWIVEIRHDATHGTMPPLSMLRAGADWALSWLKTEFWENQLRTMETPISEKSSITMPTKEDVCRLLDNYIQSKANSDTSYGQSEMGKAVENLEKMLLLNSSLTMQCLLIQKYLLSTDRHTAVADSSDDADVMEDDVVLPFRIVLFWKPILKIIHRQKLFTKLLKEMITMVTDEDSSQNAMLLEWIMTLVKLIEEQDDRFFRCSLHIPYHILLGDCIRVPNRNTVQLIKFFLPYHTPTLTPSTMRELTRVSDIFLNETPTLESRDTSIKTLQDLSVCDTHNDDSSDDIVMSWKLCSDSVDWESCPIGLLPGQQMSYTNFDLHNESGDLYDDQGSRSDNDLVSELQSFQPLSMDTSIDSQQNSMASSRWSEEDVTQIKSLIKSF